MRVYRIFNLVVLGFLLYVLIFSLVSPLLARQFSFLPGCYHKEFTGDPCPFCGLTRDMNSALAESGNGEEINPRFKLFLSFFIIEWVIRITVTLMSFLSSRFTGRTLPVIDIAIHCVLAVIVLYALNTV